MDNGNADANAKNGGGKPTEQKRLLCVDQIYSRKDRQWHYVKTLKKPEGDKFRKYALVARRIMSSKGLPTETKIDIKSTKLAEILTIVLEGYGGIQLTSDPPELTPKALYHAWPGLEARLKDEESKEFPDVDLVADIKSAIGYLETQFSGTKANATSLIGHGEITFDLLWILFGPKQILISSSNMLDDMQATSFASGDYCESQREGRSFEVNSKMLHHDGDDLGFGETVSKIPEFQGTKKILHLPIFPLEFHQKKEQVSAQLIARGRKYLQLSEGPVFQNYRGFGISLEEVVGEEKEKKFSSTGRIMVDPAAFINQNPNATDLRKPYVYSDGMVNDVNKLTDEQIMLSNHRVLGFAFVPKKWGAFSVTSMSEVIWDEKAFDKLILAEKKRKMVRLLVQSHDSSSTSFDDIIQGKGKGLVGLLSGPPGVGKTLTAEVVAEQAKKPLYMISAGELGTTPSEVDQRLGMVFMIARRWSCVLLIDEADVFLHKRGPTDLERNALVSIFLRRLEYLQGIIILTTNRRDDIDEAFKSRIHFKFDYPSLDEADRLSIWKTHLATVTTKAGNPKLGDLDLSSLAKREMNGREIKNTISCAVSIAEASNESLSLELFQDVLEVLIDDS